MNTNWDWYSLMPRLPLEKAVPLIAIFPHNRKVASRCVVEKVATNGTVELYEFGGIESHIPTHWRVDLSHPQGFAYALRYLHRTRPTTGLASVGIFWGHITDTNDISAAMGHALVMRHLAGETTDADKLALAQVLSAYEED